MTATRVFVGLGSNLENPLEQITRACLALQHLARTNAPPYAGSGGLADSKFTCSPLYQSKAVGPEQPDYINGCATFLTDLSPLKLLDALQDIENAQGRTRSLHWGPRTLDLDMLLYGSVRMDSERLQLPHPFLQSRNFVVVPLFDLAPNLVLPCGTPIAHLRTKLGDKDLNPLATKVLPT